MNASRTAAIVVGVNLIAVWVAAAAGGLAAQPIPAAVQAAAADHAVEEASSMLTAAALRLEAHARRRGTEARVTRDPFRFGAGSRLAARPSAGLPEAAREAGPGPIEALATAPAFDVVLQGMAESQEGDTVVRTAILKVDGELVLATVGMAIGGRYQVVAIAADSVEIDDTIGHSRRTCRMK